MRGWCLVAVVLQGLFLGPCAAADWRIGVDQGFREARLGIGFGSPELRSEFSAADLPGLDSPLVAGGQRTLLEVLVIGAVLRRVDPAARIVLTPVSNIRRGIVLLQAQALEMLGQTLTDGDVELNREKSQRHSGMLRSPPLIRRNEYELGIFSTVERSEVLDIVDARSFRSLRGVTVASWAGDIALMRRIVGENLVTVPRRDMIAPAIANRRGDFTFSFLSEPIVTRIGGELHRIPGFKVKVPDERAYYMSVHCTDLLRGFETTFAEWRGRRPDVLVEALTRAGTFSPEYRDWLDLAPGGP